jgi:Rrf2 family protein
MCCRGSVTTDTFAGDALGYSALNRSELDSSGPDSRLTNENMRMEHDPLSDLPKERRNSSMQLTRAADYAVRVMVHLATLPPEKRAFLPDLAEATATPESFLSKVMQALGRAGLISSRRGKLGGFAILPRGREATMRDVIESVEGPICLNACLNGGKDCGRKSCCPAHPVWARAQRAMVDVLMSVTVSAMASRTWPKHNPDEIQTLSE